MNIAPTKKWSIKKSEGKPLFQSGKNSKVEKRLYMHYLIYYLNNYEWLIPKIGVFLINWNLKIFKIKQFKAIKLQKLVKLI